MNKEWAELNKTMQTLIKKDATYKKGIGTLIDLRNHLMETLISFRSELCREEFNAIPFINADGYHSKTIAYSIWHIFRIEDIKINCLQLKLSVGKGILLKQITVLYKRRWIGGPAKFTVKI